MKLSEASIIELLDGLKTGRFTSRELVETYIRRIHQVNPQIRAISEINPDAIDLAIEKDDERAAGKAHGTLHGLPVLVKDFFLTTDRLRSTFGCSGLLNAIPKVEATTVKKLRDQGAIILGKTVPTEWANCRSPEQAPGGWSAVGGQCMAHYHENQDPSGSSSGSAVAAGMGLAAASLGTETSGSISSPAQKAAVVGIKPTVGLTSRYGVCAINEWQDTVGVLARSVHDAATILSAIAGPDLNDPFTISYPNDEESIQKPTSFSNFAAACDSEGLRGVRVAVPRHLFGDDQVVNSAFDQALKTMASLGATVVDNVTFSEFSKDYTSVASDQWALSFRILLRNNIAKTLANFRTNPSGLDSLAKVISYTRDTPEEENEKWGMTEFIASEQVGQKYDMDSDEFKVSLSRRHRIGRQIPELLDRHNCDLIAVPSIDTSADVGGCPTVAVPSGFYPEQTPIQRRRGGGLVTVGPNVPFGILFVGRRFDDMRLISAAHAFEQATQTRRLVKPVVNSDIEIDSPRLHSNVRPTL